LDGVRVTLMPSGILLAVLILTRLAPGVRVRLGLGGSLVEFWLDIDLAAAEDGVKTRAELWLGIDLSAAVDGDGELWLGLDLAAAEDGVKTGGEL